jgi:hypothetical protein
MTFARSPTHCADVLHKNFTCTSLPLSKSFEPCQHKRARHSTISLSQQESLELSPALHESIYDKSTTLAPSQMSQTTLEALPPQHNLPRDARPTDGAISGSSRDLPDMATSSQEVHPSLSLVSTDDGVTILHYPDGRMVIQSIPKNLQSLDNVKEIFQDLFEPIPDYPLDSEGGAPSTYQFLESWLATSPHQWSLADPYFRQEALNGSTTWSVNPCVLDVLITTIRSLQHSLKIFIRPSCHNGRHFLVFSRS